MQSHAPWRRSAAISDISDAELKKLKWKARRPVTGKTVKLPAYIDYRKRYGKYITGNPEVERNEKKIRNKYSDRMQHARYKKMLGADVPEMLDDFQKMKYIDDKNWKYAKLDYRCRNELLEYPEKRLPGAENAVPPDRKFTRYLFGGSDERGLAKGRAFCTRLGYDKEGWQELQADVKARASLYLCAYKTNNGYGDLYEQKMILYGNAGKLTNVIIGWIQHLGEPISVTSAYIYGGVK